jgi:outer membrane protein OmpA-like peptidoglycan-associated protein
MSFSTVREALGASADGATLGVGPGPRARMLSILASMTYDEQVAAVRPGSNAWAPPPPRPASEGVVQYRLSGSESAGPVQLRRDRQVPSGASARRLEDGLELVGFAVGSHQLEEVHQTALVELRYDLEERAEAAGWRRADWWRAIEDVIGFASPEGEADDNRELSRRRAYATADFLFTGLDVAWQSADLLGGYGEDHPGANAPREEYPQWRKVWIFFRDLPGRGDEESSAQIAVSEGGADAGASSERTHARVVGASGRRPDAHDLVGAASDVATMADVALGTTALVVAAAEAPAAAAAALSGVLFQLFALVELGRALQGYDDEVAYCMGWAYGFTAAATEIASTIPGPVRYDAAVFREGVRDGGRAFRRYRDDVCRSNRTRTAASLDDLNARRRDARSELPQMSYNEWFCHDMDPSNPEAHGSRVHGQEREAQVRYLQVVAYARAQPLAFLNQVWREILATELTRPVAQAYGEGAGRNDLAWPNWRAENPETGFSGRRQR